MKKAIKNNTSVLNQTNEYHIDFMNELHSFFDRYKYCADLPLLHNYASANKKILKT